MIISGLRGLLVSAPLQLLTPYSLLWAALHITTGLDSVCVVLVKST